MRVYVYNIYIYYIDPNTKALSVRDRRQINAHSPPVSTKNVGLDVYTHRYNIKTVAGIYYKIPTAVSQPAETRLL